MTTKISGMLNPPPFTREQRVLGAPMFEGRSVWNEPLGRRPWPGSRHSPKLGVVVSYIEPVCGA